MMQLSLRFTSFASDLLRRFSSDKRGVSAIEFAFVFPFMLTLYFGGVQISQAIGIDRKITLTARTLADLVAQTASIDSNGVTTVLNAGKAVMSPYADSTANAAKLTTRVSMISIDAQSKATVLWSKASKGAPLSGTVTVPPALLVPNTSLVLGEAFFQYDPPLGYSLTGTINMADKIYMRPRLSASVPCSNC